MELLLPLTFTAVTAGFCGGLIGFAIHHGATAAGETAAWLRGWNERGDINALKPGIPE